MSFDPALKLHPTVPMGAVRSRLQLGAELRDDERVDKPAEEIGVAQVAFGVEVAVRRLIPVAPANVVSVTMPAEFSAYASKNRRSSCGSRPPST